MGLGGKNNDFILSAMPDLLDQAVDYIAKNVDPRLVYGEDVIKEFAAQLMSVEEFQKLKEEVGQ